MTEADLERRLFAPTGGERRRGLAEPDWAAVHHELRRKNVTLSLLWEEYRAAHPDDGYGYSRFCDLYRRWKGRLSPVMRQHHVAGERVFGSPGDYVTFKFQPTSRHHLEEAGDRLFTFTRLDPAQWKAARTTNAIERLNEEFRRRIKTQAVLPCAETVPMLLWALLASGQYSATTIMSDTVNHAGRWPQP